MIMMKIKISLYLKIKNLFNSKITFSIYLRMMNLFYRAKNGFQILFFIYNYLFFHSLIFYLIIKRKFLKIKN